MDRLLDQLSGSASDREKAYALVWLVHLTGDAHQPLHAIDRFSEAFPRGDGGGNFVFVEGGRTLHQFWDELPGTDSHRANVDRRAKAVMRGFSAERVDVGKPRDWVEESFALAGTVYAFGNQAGSKESPVRLPPGYENSARALTSHQLAAAGIRLAGVLNSRIP
jgi:hypothetical protein